MEDGVGYLDWPEPVGEVAGYFVYRAVPGQPFQRLHSSPVSTNSYAGRSGINGHYYPYMITAVDRWGNEWQETEPIAPRR